MTNPKLFAKLSRFKGPIKVTHYIGMPPELTEGEDLREKLGQPILAIIEENIDGVFLKRYDRNGNCVGDTWHMNIDDAKEQALFEYGSAILTWEDVPSEVRDAVSFVLESF